MYEFTETVRNPANLQSYCFSLCRFGTNTLDHTIVVDLGGIMVLHGDRGVIEGGQQVLLDVPHLGGVVFEAIKHKADVSVIQLQ